jgi:hypothetical protein
VQCGADEVNRFQAHTSTLFRGSGRSCRQRESCSPFYSWADLQVKAENAGWFCGLGRPEFLIAEFYSLPRLFLLSVSLIYEEILNFLKPERGRVRAQNHDFSTYI